MAVKLYKLSSGEEIIGDVRSTNDTSVILNDVVLIVYSQNKEGDMATNFAPFLPFADKDISINLNTVCATADVKANLLSEYSRIFSKIQIAPAGTILS